MATIELQISLRYARKAFQAIDDTYSIREALEQTSSDVYELPEYNEWDAEETEEHEALKDDIRELFEAWGIPEAEYDFVSINQDPYRNNH